MTYPEKYNKLKACPFRLGNSRHATLGGVLCLKADCLAWDDQKGCVLLDKGVQGHLIDTLTNKGD